MRMRRKKHLAERVEKVSDILTVSDSDVLNCVIAERDKKYFDYKSLFGKIPEAEAIHGGLECGIFAEGIQNIDCISYGPQIEDIHSVHERVAVDSIDRTWKLTKEILRRLK